MASVQNTIQTSKVGASHERGTLLKWMLCLEDYGQIWLDDVGRDFFSQEYWYLFTITLVHHWRESPLNISDACQSMKTGSFKTRENRLKKLIATHWFIKIKNRNDLRQTYLEPTTEMLRNGRVHFGRSLGQAVKFLETAQLLEANPQPLLDKIISGYGEDVDKQLLLPWAEFLIDYTDDWNNTFRKRFHTEEYWHPFVYSLLGCWEGQPLTMSEACQSMRTGSGRTREKRIALAVSRGMLARQESKNDKRTTLILTSSNLENLLLDHFNRTLNKFRTLTRQLLEKPLSLQAETICPEVRRTAGIPAMPG